MEHFQTIFAEIVSKFVQIVLSQVNNLRSKIDMIKIKFSKLVFAAIPYLSPAYRGT